MTVNIKDLEAQAMELEKSLNPQSENGDGEATTEQAPTELSLLNKTLNILERFIPPQLRKSGETKQPHGDQNSLNSGEMSSSKKIPKKFNYDEKMEDKDIEYPDNSEVPYYDEKRNVRKSETPLTDIQNDPDLSDEDRVFVVNEYLEKGFARQERMEADQRDLRKAVDAVALGMHVLLGAYQKSLTMQANTGRGRISQLSIVDKPAAAKSVPNNGNGVQLSRMEISTRMLKAQKSGKLSYNDVALGEQFMNDGMEPPPQVMAAIRGIE